MRVRSRLIHSSMAAAAVIVGTLSVAAASESVVVAAQGAAAEAMASARPSKAIRSFVAPRRAVTRSAVGTCSGVWCGRHFVLMLGVAY